MREREGEMGRDGEGARERERYITRQIGERASESQQPEGRRWNTSIPRSGGNRLRLAAANEQLPDIMSGKCRASVDDLYISAM